MQNSRNANNSNPEGRRPGPPETMNREVGGRRLRHLLGEPKYDDDFYRGQRRRPWMCFRVGTSTLDFPTEQFVAFIGKVHKSMIDAGLLLDDEKHVLKITCTDNDFDILRAEIEEGLRKCLIHYDPGPLSIPITILILDQIDASEMEQLDIISNDFAPRCHFFKLERDEIITWVRELEYGELDQECVKFAQYLADSEGLVESIACRIPPEEKINTFGNDMAGLRDDEVEEDAQQMHRQMRQSEALNQMEMERRAANLRLLARADEMDFNPPPGLGPSCSKLFGRQIPGGPPPGLPPPGLGNQTKSFGNRDPISPPGFSIPPPPGLVSRPPGLSVQARLNQSDSSVTISDFSSDISIPDTPPNRQIAVEKEVNGKHILSHEDVRAALNVVKEIEPEGPPRGVPTTKHNDLLGRSINGSKLYERFSHPFVDITHNLDLLTVINFALASRSPDVYNPAKQILRGIFNRGYSVKLRQKYLDRPFVNGQWTDDAATLFFEIVILYFNTARYRGGFMLTIDSFLSSWSQLLSSFEKCDTKSMSRFGKVTEQEFHNLGKVIEHIKKWIHNAQEAARQERLDETNVTSMDESIVNPPRRAIDHREGPSSSVTSSVDSRFPNERRQTEEERYREVQEQRRRLQQENEYKRGLEGRRREEEERRRLQAEEDERFWRSEEARRRLQAEEDERYNREERYQAEQNEYRRQISRLGFQNGGGTAGQMDADNEYPIIDISDSTIDVDDDSDDVKEDVQENLPTHNTDERPKQPYKYVEGYEDGYEPPYMKCERMEPPEDFKTLTSVPTLVDYVNPTEPYLRRIQELGVYKNTQHYLDVQFRLLREDLVSPMRDGIEIFRRNGTCKGNRLPNQPCSDIAIFSIEIVDGKQVTERDGHEMRLIWPAQYDRGRLTENDKEMKELGLVMLSGDRFVNDFHLGHIQQSLLRERGCLHLAVHCETQPFQPNKTYQMAQATSYLPSYKHVLENLKTISPFKPIPFERYIVYGKKEIYRPNFHRFTKSPEQEAEEQKTLHVYEEIRSHKSSKRYMEGKPIPKGIREDYDTIMKEPTKADIDLEYLQLKEPIFRDFVGVDTKGSDFIQINKKWYKISRLLDDFHPTNMDESQRRAFCNTFKYELSLIQGPPGTGKTHIGVEIIKTMLHNRTHWRMTEPILVVCFTNSGLDNLLERIYSMIEMDEELSKDNGKPKMIRYGRKCESEYLKRRNVMRYDVYDLYRSTVSEHAQRDQSKAGSHKRKMGADLVLSSYTLYCSRNDLLSYLILSRVMHPNHQTEINAFANEHVDSKEHPLNGDEAIACWLLDRDFGRATKAQTKKAKKGKFQAIREESDDDEETNRFLTIQDSDGDEDDEEMDDERRLDKLFNKMNVGCSGKDILGMARASAADEYYTKGTWELAHDHRPPEVVLMGKKSKSKQSTHPIDEHLNTLVKEVKEMILATPPLPKHELEDIKHIFSLSRPKRWALYVTWCDAVRNLVVEGLPKQIEDYRIACEVYIKVQDRVDAELMKMPMIIGATTTGCSRLRPILEHVEPRILIVEEAAEVLEAHILSAMISSVEHCVMIGDHKQLRPNPAVHELGTAYGMRISMFERLVERALPFSQLREQHRMNLLISDTIVKPAFYDNVVDAENVALYPDVEGMATNLYFWSHSKLEETPDGISWFNRREAEMTVGLIRHLLKQNYTNQDIVVLATYSAQRQYMYREYPSIFGPPPDNTLIPVETVDSFQGRERKIAILSLVRSHRGVPENSGIGFLAVANRICVALTRAQHGMYIIGNGAYIKNNSQLWSKIVEQLNRQNLVEYHIPLKCAAHGNIINIREPSDFKEFSPEGGCLEICNIEKSCGHICQRPCHPKIESEHAMRCEYKCQLKCPNPKYNHPCTRMCSEDCGQCLRHVEVTLECGHTISTPCSRIPVAQCDQICSKSLVCGHPCPAKCGAPCVDRSKCQAIVVLELDCGHLKRVKCGEMFTGEQDETCIERCENMMLTCKHQCKEQCGAPCTVECQETVTVTLPCRHTQQVICSTYMEDKLELIQCTTLVSKRITPCGHMESIPCGANPSADMCNRSCTHIIKECKHMCQNRCGTCAQEQIHVCQTSCTLILPCGHECRGKCSQKCPPCSQYCPNTCSHQSCGISGQKGYGRECSAICVLCTSTCSNKCIHRSCTMKCFEECNVKTCQEACTEKLKPCGHACLGMCGEICPTICGTCKRAEYLQCVSGIAGSSTQQRVHRLIMVPKCRHIVPVEELDEFVKQQKERGKPLHCLKCEKTLDGVVRYSKYMKKFYLDENMKKVRQSVSNVTQQTLDTRLRKVLDDTFDELRHVTTNMSDEYSNILLKFREKINWTVQGGEDYKSKAEYKYRLGFLLEVAHCFRAIARLISTASKQRISSRKDIPPALDTMILQNFGNQPFFKILEEVKRVNELMSENGKTFMLGAVLPKLRMYLSRMTIYGLISAMVYQMCIEKQGIPDQAAKAINSSCYAVLNDDGRSDVSKKLGNVVKMILSVAPKMTEGMGRKFWKWEELGVPAF